MAGLMQAWLLSRERAILNNVALVPVSEGIGSERPKVIESEEGFAYFLVDDEGRRWILKKFLPGREPELAYLNAIQTLIPRDPGFESGSERTILRARSVLRQGFYNPEFQEWIEGTILMPQVSAPTWAYSARSIREGTTTLSVGDRLLLCACLAKLVSSLESQGLAHRDLSARNILVDVATRNVHFVDWDSLYHASLRMQTETTCGTYGYMAPFVKVDGEENVHLSWKERADRFALAILSSEFLVIGPESMAVEEGGLLLQSEIDRRSGPTIFELRQRLKSAFPGSTHLFDQTIRAKTFEECPSPKDWLNWAEVTSKIIGARTK